MSDNTYNGYANYQTWAVGLWIDNDQGTSELVNEWAAECAQNAIDDDDSDVRNTAMCSLAERLESMHDENAPSVDGVFSDLLTNALGKVDWRELADGYIKEITIYSAGWNTPGYMPDNPPALFLDADDAMTHIQDAAKDSIEYDSEEAEETAGDEIDVWKADSKGEFGQKFGANFYFVSTI